MRTETIYPQVRAIYQNGVLNLLDSLDLPEGAMVSLEIRFVPSDSTDKRDTPQFIYPTRLMPVDRLEQLTGLIALGGDALG